MQSEERVNSYIRSLESGETPFLEELYAEALNDHIPVIRRELMSFLKTLLLIAGPKNILEVGCATGFSSIFMASSTDDDCYIRTIEIDPEDAEQARGNILRAGLSDRITVICGDASDVLKELEGPYDLIFMDAAKGQYLSWLPEVKRLMKSGSVLLSDNIFREGEILESRFLVERRDRTIHKRMREYLYEITHDPLLATSLLPVGDGAALSVMRL